MLQSLREPFSCGSPCPSRLSPPFQMPLYCRMTQNRPKNLSRVSPKSSKKSCPPEVPFLTGALEPSEALSLQTPLSQSIVPILPDASALRNDPEPSKSRLPSVPRAVKKIEPAGGPCPDGCPRPLGSPLQRIPLYQSIVPTIPDASALPNDPKSSH